MGGTRAVPKALVRLGRELGVQYITGQQVKSIDSQSGHVTGVTLNNGTSLKAATVVSNSDCVEPVGVAAAEGRRPIYVATKI